MEIDAAKLLILNVANTIEPRVLKELDQIMILVPSMALRAIDRAAQTLG